MDSFVQRNRKALLAALATVAAGSAAVGAYYYYKQLQDAAAGADSEGSGHLSKSQKKKNKKKAQKEKKKGAAAAAAELKPEYPLLASGKPDIAQIKTLDAAQQDAIAVQLKDQGNAYFKEQKMDEALEYYNYALDVKQDPVYYANISACYVALKDMEKVVENTTKALELKPDYSKALLRRASAYEALERYPDAMFDLSVLSLSGDFSGASIEPMLERNLNRQALKVLKEKIGDPEADPADALTVATQKQQLPSDTSMASFFGIFKPELSFDNYDEDSEADRKLKQALEELYSATANGYLDADKDFAAAEELYEAAVKDNANDDALNGKYAIALEYVGIFKFLKNDLAGAQAKIQKSIDLHPRVNSYIYMALTVADKGDSPDYTTYFDKAIALDPECSSTYYHRGQLLFITQKYDEASKNFRKAMELDDSNIFPYIQLACLAYRENKFDECKKQFDDARQKFPVAPEIPTFYAEILADKEDFDEALKQYEFARKLEDKQSCIHVGVAPLVGKATVLARQPSAENFKEAAELLKEACDKDPRSEQAAVGLAQLKLQEEDVDGAIELFEKSAELARTIEEKLQATTFAEAAKVQKRVRADPVVRAKVEEALAQYRAQGMM
ncbi:protein channel [Maudiozyma humilis]|uniref:Protein channel n=1 Tax=Maudiozyma humilis TaxID=51915 RepID=A0AAV5RV86_MAUHU|nr:protein channel [Kazachstania humilis]